VISVTVNLAGAGIQSDFEFTEVMTLADLKEQICAKYALDTKRFGLFDSTVS
jgi:hypothetical protein